MVVEKKSGPHHLKWLIGTALPKLPIFLLALPFVVLMRMLRPIIWIRLISVPEMIGHALGNTEVYLLERRAGLHPSKAVDIFYPDRPWKCNRQVAKMLKRIIPLHEAIYWIAWANKEIPGFEPYHFNSPHRDRDILGLSNDTPPLLSFNSQEEERGAVLLHAMGIPAGSQIVCFHARDSAFKKAVLPKEDGEYHNYRDVDINTYIPAIKELVSRGYYCIRMGRKVNQDFLWKDPHVIDYATSSWQSDFADLYLISRCHFYIGTGCGLDTVAATFRKPQVVVDAIPMAAVNSWSPNYLSIFKKIQVTREKRSLTFKEILGLDVFLYYFTEQYRKSGFEVIDNTDQEILDVVIEQEERMRGCWQTNDEYEGLQRGFWGLYTPGKLHQVFKARVGSKFLMHNRDLLAEGVFLNDAQSSF